jgi:hypothetical protein
VQARPLQTEHREDQETAAEREVDRRTFVRHLDQLRELEVPSDPRKDAQTEGHPQQTLETFTGHRSAWPQPDSVQHRTVKRPRRPGNKARIMHDCTHLALHRF